MHFTANGLVLKEIPLGDFDKLLTILFEQRGKLTVSAKNSKRLKSPLFAAAQPFVFGSYTVFENKGRFMLDSGEAQASFYGLRTDIEKLAVAAYITELCNLLTDENMPEDNILRLALNCLYGLSEKNFEPKLVKAVFELHAMAQCGFMPELFECLECGIDSQKYYFDTVAGGIVCEQCVKKQTAPINLYALTPSLLKVIQYISSSEPSKVFSFKADSLTLTNLYELAEKYLIYRIDKYPKTLEFYKGLSI